MGRELRICSEGELEDGDVRIVSHGDLEIGLIRHNGRYFAYRNLCPHQGGPACEGMRIPRVEDVLGEDQGFLCQRFDEDDMHIVCPWHGYEYHLETGVNVADTRLKLSKYKVVEKEGAVYVEL